MPTYPVINLKTGETKELSMSMVKYDEWRKENPDWDKDWQAGCAIPRNEVLDRASKQPGSTVRKFNNY